MTPDRPNVVLLVMDTARARDVLGRTDVTPNLHRIAEAGGTYPDVFATGPWTLPSHASMFTGQYTADHWTHAGSPQFDPDVAPIAEVLRAAGYHTAAFSNNSWVSPEFGFDRGFESFGVAWDLFDSDADLVRIAKEADGLLAQAAAVARRLPRRDGLRTLAAVLHAKLFRRRYDDGARVTNWRIKRWLDRERDGDEPFFLFVNYQEPHLEYRPPRGYRSRFLPDDVEYAEAKAVNQDAWSYLAGDESMDDRDFEILRALYRAELHYLDERIGRLYDHLAARGELEDTLLLVVGDHGENIGDHGLMDHQYCLYDTLIHVPLICHAPAGIEVPAQRDGLRELRDLYPTVLDAAGLERPSESTVSTRSLLDPGGREHVVAEYVVPQPDVAALERRVGAVRTDLDRFDRGLRCLRTADWKYVEGTDGSAACYRIADGEEVPAWVRVPDDVDRSGEPVPHGERVRGPGIDGASTPAASGIEVDADAVQDARTRLRSLLHDRYGEMARPEEPPAGDEASDPEVGASTRKRLEDIGYI